MLQITSQSLLSENQERMPVTTWKVILLNLSQRMTDISMSKISMKSFKSRVGLGWVGNGGKGLSWVDQIWSREIYLSLGGGGFEVLKYEIKNSPWEGSVVFIWGEGRGVNWSAQFRNRKRFEFSVRRMSRGWGEGELRYSDLKYNTQIFLRPLISETSGKCLGIYWKFWHLCPSNQCFASQIVCFVETKKMTRSTTGSHSWDSALSSSSIVPVQLLL